VNRFRFCCSKLLKAGLGLLLLAAVLVSGCATAEPDNLSARPWNSPKGWENGLPSGMMEGR
jgi:hypothetical protein